MSRITDYKGKVVHVGIDVHKKTYHVTAVYQGEVVKKASVKAVPFDLATS